MSSLDLQPPRERDNRRKKRALFSLLILGALSTIVGVGTFADFTAGTVYTGNSFATAHVQINSNNQADAATLAMSLTFMEPGDTVSKFLNVTNTGDTDILSYSLKTAATTSSALDAGGASTRLKVWVSRCTVAFGGTPQAPVCGGTQYDLIGTAGAPVNIIFGTTAIPNTGGTDVFCRSGYSQHATRGVAACDVTDTDFVLIRVSLPSTGAAGANPGAVADWNNDVQGLTSVISFSFSGAQPAAHNF